MGKACTVMMNQETHKKRQQTHTSVQTIIVFIILIQEKNPLVTQKTQKLKVMLYRLKRQQKAIKGLKEF